MSLIIREVKSKSDLRRYIHLPEKIHRNHSTWVPPIYLDEWIYYNPSKNPAHRYCETVLALAWRGNDVVGRIMGLINRRYNEIHHVRTARFSYLESWEDAKVIRDLLRFVEKWALDRDMDRLVGPYAFNDLDPQGFLIEGFDHRATIVTIHNYPWMPSLVEEAGYRKEVDYYVYQLDVPGEISPLLHRIAERIERRGKFSLLKVKHKRDFRPWIKPMIRLMNETFLSGDIYGYTPLDEDEMEALAKKYMLFFNPNLVKLVLRNNEVVGFMLAAPDISRGLQKARGRLLPFGWYHLLRSMKKHEQLDFVLGAIKEDCRGLGLDALMAMNMFLSARKMGFTTIDTHSELESNIKIRALAEKFGGRLYKKFRVYQRKL